MVRLWKVFIAILLIFSFFVGVYWAYSLAAYTDTVETSEYASSPEESGVTNSQNRDKDETEVKPIPTRKVLNNNYHIFQTFNNCGPASLSMALYYYGYNVSQSELGNDLRPYQHPTGDNDDKSVTLYELAEKSKEYDLVPYHRPNGDIEILKRLIAADLPVVTRTWLNPNEDIGHYRVVKGYDETRGILIQDDSLQGANLEYTYNELLEIWKPFNYEYLVLVPKDKVKEVEAILGPNVDEDYAWQKSLERSIEIFATNPTDVNAGLNISVAHYNLGHYPESIEAFEQVETRLPSRALWYQIEPIKSYYELGNYDRVFEITNRIINNHNRAFSELYIIRGDIYKERGQINQARAEYEKAVLYNKNLEAAQIALESL